MVCDLDLAHLKLVYADVACNSMEGPLGGPTPCSTGGASLLTGCFQAVILSAQFFHTVQYTLLLLIPFAAHALG